MSKLEIRLRSTSELKTHDTSVHPGPGDSNSSAFVAGKNLTTGNLLKKLA